MELNHKIVSGIGWTSLATAGSQGIRLVFKLILAKLLLPEHYGIIGMASVFISFVEVVSELGLTSALIQKKREHITTEYYNTAFWANLIITLIGYVAIIVIAAPFASWFYKEAILKEIIPILAISIVLDAFYVIPRIKLSRKMYFKPQAIIQISAALVAGITAVILAYAGFGVWALAFNGILTSLISGILYCANVRWVPAWQFSKAAFHDLFGFGSKVLVERIFSFFTLNIDYILIGKLIGESALGAYTLAFILTNTFMKQIVKVLNKVLYPAYSAMQDDIKKIGHYYLRLARLNNLLMAPIMLLFIVLGNKVIYVGFGPEWEQTIVPLRILALAVIISSIGGSASIVMRSVGRPDLSMKVNMYCTTFSTVPLVVAGAIYFGIQGAAFGILTDRFVRLFVYQYHIHKLVGVSMMELSKQVSATLLTCTVIGIIVYSLDNVLHISDMAMLLTGGATIVVLYSIYLYLFERATVSRLLDVMKIRQRIPLLRL